MPNTKTPIIGIFIASLLFFSGCSNAPQEQSVIPPEHSVYNAEEWEGVEEAEEETTFAIQNVDSIETSGIASAPETPLYEYIYNKSKTKIGVTKDGKVIRTFIFAYPAIQETKIEKGGYFFQMRNDVLYVEKKDENGVMTVVKEVRLEDESSTNNSQPSTGSVNVAEDSLDPVERISITPIAKEKLPKLKVDDIIIDSTLHTGVGTVGITKSVVVSNDNKYQIGYMNKGPVVYDWDAKGINMFTSCNEIKELLETGKSGKYSLTLIDSNKPHSYKTYDSMSKTITHNIPLHNKIAVISKETRGNMLFLQHEMKDYEMIFDVSKNLLETPFCYSSYKTVKIEPIKPAMGFSNRRNHTVLGMKLEPLDSLFRNDEARHTCDETYVEQSKAMGYENYTVDMSWGISSEIQPYGFFRMTIYLPPGTVTAGASFESPNIDKQIITNGAPTIEDLNEIPYGVGFIETGNTHGYAIYYDFKHFKSSNYTDIRPTHPKTSHSPAYIQDIMQEGGGGILRGSSANMKFQDYSRNENYYDVFQRWKKENCPVDKEYLLDEKYYN